jgi:hypothetical protein
MHNNVLSTWSLNCVFVETTLSVSQSVCSYICEHAQINSIILSIILYISDYGDQEIAELVDYFRTGLIEAGIEVEMIEMEWTKLKHNLMTRYLKQ